MEIVFWIISIFVAIVYAIIGTVIFFGEIRANEFSYIFGWGEYRPIWKISLISTFWPIAIAHDLIRWYWYE